MVNMAYSFDVWYDWALYTGLIESGENVKGALQAAWAAGAEQNYWENGNTIHVPEWVTNYNDRIV